LNRSPISKVVKIGSDRLVRLIGTETGPKSGPSGTQKQTVGEPIIRPKTGHEPVKIGKPVVQHVREPVLKILLDFFN
jgi:hypothetical protein